MDPRILAQNIINNPSDFTAEQIEKAFKEYAYAEFNSNKKYIAFQSVDPEGDVWCNILLLFETEDDVTNFFNNPQRVIDTLGLEVDPEADGSVDDSIAIYQYPNGSISGVKIELEYCGSMIIKRASAGYLIHG